MSAGQIFGKSRVIALLGVLVIAGCGVKGPLEPPPGSQAAAPIAAQTEHEIDPALGNTITGTKTEVQSSNPATITSPLVDDNRKRKRVKRGNVPLTSEPEKPNQTFILDGLL
ncbi:MAG: lipoprotein [Xanthobacteraceae bacterium]|nr:lipoprotein [Xanthobacteraceae bacterium]QYK44787.1 MAG: lipoprotein [Xanthobacteraceae bacterium]HMN51296.1 lipoprotein [Xanthobacteraceae bacterium]